MGPKPTAEFRQEVVRVALTSGLSRKQIAMGFEIGFSTLSRWIKEDAGSRKSGIKFRTQNPKLI